MTSPVELPAPSRGAYDRSLSRAERDAQHRERLLIATAQVLDEGNVTVARIVERAGVGRSTFYEFFDGPEHVIAHLQQRAVRGFEQALEAALASAHTPLERLRAIAPAWLAVIDAQPSAARVGLARRVERELLAPATQVLLRALERATRTATRNDETRLAAIEEAQLLAVAAAVEALSRRHVYVQPLRGGASALTELIVKMLR